MPLYAPARCDTQVAQREPEPDDTEEAAVWDRLDDDARRVLAWHCNAAACRFGHDRWERAAACLLAWRCLVDGCDEQHVTDLGRRVDAHGRKAGGR